MKRKIFCLLTALMLAVGLLVPAFASDVDAAQEPIEIPHLICDEGDVLKKSSEKQLEELAQRSYEATGIPLGFVSLPSAPEGELYQAVKEYYDEHMGAENGMLLGHNVDTGKFVLFSCGTCRDFLQENDDENYETLTNLYADDPDYAPAIEKVIREAYHLMTDLDLDDAANAKQTERTKPLVVDEADVLSELEKDELNEMAENIAAQYPYEAAVVIVDDVGSMTAQDYADNYYDQNGYGYGDGNDGIMLLIAVESRDYSMTTYGAGIEKFPDFRLEYMEDDLLDVLEYDDWALAAEYFLRDVEFCLDDSDPAYGEEDYADYEDFDLGFIPLAMLPVYLLIGIGLGGIPVGVMKRKMKNVQLGRDAENYTVSVILSKKVDRFLWKDTKRRRIDSDSSGGGSSGGSRSHSTTHTSSSGRTHGGRSGKF